MLELLIKHPGEEIKQAVQAAGGDVDLVTVPRLKLKRILRSGDHGSKVPITQRKNGLPYDAKKRRPVPYITAVWFHGVLVAARDDYDRLMAGTSSSRKVLAV